MNEVSIILPVYNCENFIEEAIDSIINQSFQKWELIIIDDASTDNTLSKIQNYLKDNRIVLKKLKRNKRAGFCRNLAIRQSNSTYVAFIDSDDIWEKEKLKKQIEFMNRNKLDLTYTNYTPFKEKNGVKKFKKEIIPYDSFSYDLFIKKTSICTSSMVVKREKIGLTKFLRTKICEDYFFKCSLLKKCQKVKNLCENLTFYRISQNSLQSKKLRNLYWVWYINKRYNKMSTLKNLLSLTSISINSLKNYGFK